MAIEWEVMARNALTNNNWNLKPSYVTYRYIAGPVIFT